VPEAEVVQNRQFIYTAIYFADVFFFIFLMVDIWDPVAQNQIFTKISGLVDGFKGSFTSLSCFDFSRVVATATN